MFVYIRSGISKFLVWSNFFYWSDAATKEPKISKHMAVVKSLSDIFRTEGSIPEPQSVENVLVGLKFNDFTII